MGRLISIIIAISLLSMAMVSCSVGDTPVTDLAGTGIGREEPTTDATATAAPPEDKNITICVDPGHGFADGGTSSAYLGGLNEKDITISISMMLKAKLEAMGYDVILTHDGESFPKSSIDDGNQIYNTHERISYTDTLDIDMLISVHCNAAASSDASGTRIYYYEQEYGDNTAVEKYTALLAQNISAAIPDGKFPEIYAENLYVVRYCHVVSALVETGFVTNPSDAAKLIDPLWQDKMAEGIAEGIDAYWRTTTN